MTIEAQIIYLKKRSEFTDDYLDFHKEILTLQADQQSKLIKENISIFSKTSDVDSRLYSGLPLLDKNNLYIEANFAQSGFVELLSIFEHYPQSYSPDKIETLRNALTNNNKLSIELIQNFVSENKGYFNQASRANAIEPGLLIFISKTIGLPLLKTYADLLKSYLAEKDKIWFQPFCPLCGNAAAMARLENETGQRHLWCMVCHTEWPFKRSQCAFCSQEDPSPSRYFFDENDSLYRVYVCDHCKHYIKTIDENNFTFNQPLNMALEYLITHYLDETATTEGYQSMLWWNEFDHSKD